MPSCPMYPTATNKEPQVAPERTSHKATRCQTDALTRSLRTNDPIRIKGTNKIATITAMGICKLLRSIFSGRNPSLSETKKSPFPIMIAHPSSMIPVAMIAQRPGAGAGTAPKYRCRPRQIPRTASTNKTNTTEAKIPTRRSEVRSSNFNQRRTDGKSNSRK